MLNSEILPKSGYGSLSWFEKTFNFQVEYEHFVQVLAKVNPLVALKSLTLDVATFCTEWGAGREALTVQPPTKYIIRNDFGHLTVYMESLNELGEQLSGYLAFDELPPAVNLGLKRAFLSTFDLNEDEGVVINSTTEFYEEHESSGDVLDPIVVDEVIKNEAGEVVEVRATGWFLFLNRKLTNEERQFWLDCHNVDPVIYDGNPATLVASPQFWTRSPHDENETDNNAAALDYMSWLNVAFINHFGKPLFVKKEADEDQLRHHIFERVEYEVDALKNLLLQKSKLKFFEKLFNLLEGGQRKWAEIMNIDFDWYWAQVMAGIIQILGFHPTDGSSLVLYWNFSAQDWIGGTRVCSLNEVKSKKHCDKHSDYSESCPDCKKKMNN